MQVFSFKNKTEDYFPNFYVVQSERTKRHDGFGKKNQTTETEKYSKQNCRLAGQIMNRHETRHYLGIFRQYTIWILVQNHIEKKNCI